MRWVGIDEAGYGPNLGPLVMSAVAAESNPDSDAEAEGLDPPSRFWDELQATVTRAGIRDPGGRLCIDDSKAVLKGGKGRDRLTASCLALLDAVGLAPPGSARDLACVLCAARFDEAELDRWLPDGPRDGLGRLGATARSMGARLASRPLSPPCGAWRLAAVRSEIVGPERFNKGLERHDSKAGVHFEAFARLLSWAWELGADGRPTQVQSDKHGGRHYYLEPLLRLFPDAWIDRGDEGPELSSYTIRGSGRTLHLRLSPRADARDGLVALASIVSKTLREEWMDVFNAFWTQRVPGLRPTAGYPVDAARFRLAVEPTAAQLGLDPRVWWRER